MSLSEITASRGQPESGNQLAGEVALQHIARQHACSSHELFSYLEHQPLTVTSAGALLRNYDAHASSLRRLLLRASTLMPEPAVGYILENIRNEYGNGDYAGNHQAQLRDLARCSGVDSADFCKFTIEPGVKLFIKSVSELYVPSARHSNRAPQGFYKPAIAAGAITATELLAIKEFELLQKAFGRIGHEHHIWFHHVSIEAEHSDESLALARYFIENHDSYHAVEYGLRGVLDANVHLYDGLLAALHS